MSRAPLVRALRATQRAREHAECHPLRYVRWRPWQEEYLACRDPRKLLRLGNGPGKAQPTDAPVLTPTGWCLIGHRRAHDGAGQCV